MQEFPFEHVKLGNGYATDFGIKVVGAKGITETFARDGYRRNDESMTSKRR